MRKTQARCEGAQFPAMVGHSPCACCRGTIENTDLAIKVLGSSDSEQPHSPDRTDRTTAPFRGPGSHRKSLERLLFRYG